jgi:hypothetical protein
MNTKPEMLTQLQSEFDRWEQLLNTLRLEQITAPNFISSWSIQDVLAHLMAWQMRSIARLEAASFDREPEFPHWPLELDPDFVEDPDQLNAWLYKLYHADSWPSIHQAWQSGFRHFLELARAIPEADLLDPHRFPWMNGQPLMLVLQSSYDHHHLEHLEPLLARLQQSGSI